MVSLRPAAARDTFRFEGTAYLQQASALGVEFYGPIDGGLLLGDIHGND